MSENAIIMKKEIRAVSNYRALIISKYYLTSVLGITSLYLGFLRYAMSPLYILLLLNILPPILVLAFLDYGEKYNVKVLLSITKDSPFQLRNLKTKYNYSKLRYVTNSVSFLFALILIGLWQFNYNTSVNINTGLLKLPIIILTTCISIRFLGAIFYQIKIHYDLSHNRV
ncbi:MAG: hypothetical protein ACYDEX_25975 [Mobilitalea sp.]